MNDKGIDADRPVDLWSQLESLFNVVFECERQWTLDERFDLILGVQSRGAAR